MIVIRVICFDDTGICRLIETACECIHANEPYTDRITVERFALRVATRDKNLLSVAL